MTRNLQDRNDGRPDLETVGAWALIVVTLVAVVAGAFIGQTLKAERLCRDGVAAYCQDGGK